MTFDETFPFMANIASILGLFVSLFAAWKITVLSRKLRFVTRVPDLIRQFKTITSVISSLLLDFKKNKENIIDQIACCEGILEEIKKYLNHKEKADINKYIKIMKVNRKGKNIDKTMVRNVIYSENLKLIVRLENILKNYLSEANHE